ncbi:hypothetical protein JXA47_06870, partial [Candidatus Sumerlaeota bacterium]|nr:hypothetical protein [Candidatus Sumerlaeota bacterium]
MRTALIASLTALALTLPAQEVASPEALEVVSPEALERELEASRREHSALEEEQERAETLVDRSEEAIALEQRVIDEQIEGLEILTGRFDTLSIRSSARRARIARLRAHIRRAIMPLALGDQRTLDPQSVAAVAFSERATRQITYLEESLEELDLQVAALTRERERILDRIAQAEVILADHAALHGERAERLAAIRERQTQGELRLGQLIDELNTLTPTVMLTDAAPVEMFAPQLPPPE